MAKDEISAGIKNALERGESLEQAVQSFINAGYNPVEVREIASNTTGGVSKIINYPQYKNSPEPQPLMQLPEAEQPQHAVQSQSLMSAVPPVKEDLTKKKIILLILILVFIILLLTLFLLYKDSILNYLLEFASQF